MDVVHGVAQAVMMLFAFALWVLPIAVAVWLLLRLSAVARDVSVLKRQLAAIAEHTGAPVVAQPPAPRGTRAPLWALLAVLVAFGLVLGLLYAAPGMSWRLEATELEREEGSRNGSATMPMPMPGPVREEPTP